jgi:hypothetical protein
VTRLARRRRLTFATAAVLVVIAGAAAVSGDAAAVTETLPDLAADRPTNATLQTYSRPGSPNHLLLRFEGYVHNRGAGALEVRGSGPAGGRMSATAQRIYRSDGTWADDSSRGVQMIWEAEDGHDHWHIKHAARYSLWSADRTAMVAPAQKVGFCLIDSQHVDSHGPGSQVYRLSDNDFCAQGRPQVPSLVEGVSAGWRDVYVRTLAFQWVDVSDVQPGTYWLRTEVDPDNWARESDESNAPAYASNASTIPGYVARGVDAGIISTTAPTNVRLATVSYGSNLGSPEFRITAPPRHGRLSRAVGAPFQGGDVVYTPDPGWLGPDRFTYEARDSTSEFPRYPTSAAATVAVGGLTPAVAISGAPASMYTGTSARLTAHLLRPEGVTWTVNGIPGGSRDVGTIDGSGLYVAPSSVPPGGQVTIRATTASGAWEEVVIAIAWAPRALASPAPRGRLAMKVRGTTNLYGIRVAAQGNVLLIRVRSRRAGVLRVRVRRGKRQLGHCRARTPARRALTCKVRTRGLSHDRMRLVITLRVKGKLLDVRRASLRGLRHAMG